MKERENREWARSKIAVFCTNGASSHSSQERQKEDYYATDPAAVEHLMKLETFNQDVWECACGEGHMSRVLEQHGYRVKSSDLIDRGFGDIADFLAIDNLEWNGDIITNPPYKYAQEFVEKALQIIPNGNKVAMFLKLTFLEGQSRKALFRQAPPQFVYVSSSRLMCGKNGVFEGVPAVAYAWFIWEKGFKGEPVIRWFN